MRLALVAVVLTTNAVAFADEAKERVAPSDCEPKAEDPNAPLFVIDGRLSFGAVTDGTSSGFVREGAALGRIGLQRGPFASLRLALLPEIGGGKFETDTATASYSSAGLGIGLTYGPIVVGAVPSFVAGRYLADGQDSGVQGFRVTGVVEFMGLAGFQASRQVLKAGPRNHSQTIVTGSINLAVLILLVAD